MAVTVLGKNYNQISGCESTSDGGTWSGFDTQDAVDKKEGTYSLCGTFKSSGLNSATFTPTSAVDLSGTKHLRFWLLDSAPGLLDSLANGGIRVGVTDGVNTGYWYLGGNDTYPGGWFNFVVDVSRAVDSGTKPTSMNAITAIYIVINQTAGGKNFDNLWIDNLCVCDGLVAYGDDAGGYFDFEDIFSADDGTLGIGIIRKIGGVYFLTGSLEFGDSAGTNGCKFQAKSQVAVFEDRPVNADLYDIDIVDNGTGTTEFILGDKSGTAGIQGCTLRVESTSQTAKFDIDANTDADVDNFKMYASVFYGADTIKFANAATNVEVLGCTFEKCGQVDPDDAVTKGCFFIGTVATDAALLWNENINIEDCSFIGNTAGAGIEHPSLAGSPYSYNGHLFSGNTYDILNTPNAATVNAGSFVVGDGYKILTVGTTDFTAIGAADNNVGTKFIATGVGAGTGTATHVLVINKTNGANPTTSNNTGTAADTLFSAAFDHILTGLELNTEVTYVEAGTANELFHVENASVSDGDGKYKTTYSHGGGTSVDIFIHHVDYKPDISNIIGITLPNAAATVKVQMFSDENYYNPA